LTWTNSINYRILVVKVLTENEPGENKTRKVQMFLSFLATSLIQLSARFARFVSSLVASTPQQTVSETWLVAALVV